MDKDLRVVFVSDVQGHDDEGMKKIARRLSQDLSKQDGFRAKTMSPREALKSAQSVDIMHYVGGPTYRSVVYASWFKSQNKCIKTILTFTNPIWNLFADVSIRLFPPDCVIVQSSQWREWAEQLGLASRFVPISGVDSARFIPISTKKKLEIKSDLGFPPNKKIVLHVGHLKENRNVLRLTSLQNCADIQVVVVGSTTTKQSQSIINQLQQAECIVVNQYQPTIEYFYQAADCYVFPTVDTQACIQLPLSVFEAMATNLPVVTTRFGGLPDIFPSGEGLFYGSFESNEELVSMVNSAISSTVDTRTRALAFDWSEVATRLTKFYKELVNG